MKKIAIIISFLVFFAIESAAQSLDISSVTQIETTYSTGPQEVKAIIKVGDQKTSGSINNVFLFYEVSDLTYNAEMIFDDSDSSYSGTIPEQIRGAKITYWVEAEDSSGMVLSSDKYSYKIFKPNLGSVLLVLNGIKLSEYNKSNFYFRRSNQEFDIWDYGKLTNDLLSNYSIVIEIVTLGPLNNNKNVIRDWLNSNQYNSYLLAGANFFEFGNENKLEFSQGDFEFDILGINKAYKDVCYDQNQDVTEPTELMPIESSGLSLSLYFASQEHEGISFYYDPVYELGLENEHIDAFDPIDTTDADLQVKAQWIESENVNQNKTAMSNFYTQNGNWIGFASFDPFCINSAPQYFHWSDSTVAPHYQWLNRVSIIYAIGSVKVDFMKRLETTTSTDERLVTANVKIIQGQQGIQDVFIEYAVNDGDLSRVKMEEHEDGNYRGHIPGQQAGTDVKYRIIAVDEYGNTGYHENGEFYYYSVFKKTGAKSLLYLNGFERSYADDYKKYFRFDDNAGKQIEFDIWSNAQVSDELLSDYENVFEIYKTVKGEEPRYRASHYFISRWLKDSPNRNYFIAGSHWLGVFDESDSMDFEADDLEYFLGIKKKYENISAFREINIYPDSSGFIWAYFQNIQQTGGSEFTYKNSLINVDGFTTDPDVVIDMKAISNLDGKEYGVVGHKILNNGNKVAFMTFEPGKLIPSDNPGFNRTYPTIPDLVTEWFGIITSIDKSAVSEIPESFSLNQNYPNPFNPATMIEYSIPVVDEKFSSTTTNVKLIIYDILGREVATLVNEQQKPGTYKVEFNTNELDNIASSVLIYRLQAGEYSTARKMIVLK